jgi:hypothetical protein
VVKLFHSENIPLARLPNSGDQRRVLCGWTLCPQQLAYVVSTIDGETIMYENRAFKKDARGVYLSRKIPGWNVRKNGPTGNPKQHRGWRRVELPDYFECPKCHRLSLLRPMALLIRLEEKSKQEGGEVT